MISFQDIKQYIPYRPSYSVTVDFLTLPKFYFEQVIENGLNVSPEFQRSHVWTRNQQEKFIEYICHGGIGWNNIYLNCPNWHSGGKKDYILVDGKQRLEAVFAFLNSEFKVFGHFFREFTGVMRPTHFSFTWNINELQDYDDVLNWYLLINSGGTPHTNEEIEKARSFLGKKPLSISKEERIREAKLYRSIF